MNAHNPALAAQLAAVKAARARMGMNRYSPRVFIPPPPVECHEPAPDERQAGLPVTNEMQEPLRFVAHEVIPLPSPAQDNLALRVIAERQKIRAVIKATAEYFGLSVGDLVSNRRTGDLILPRHIAMWLCIRFKHFSYPEIGRRFGRDHTTVLFAVRKIDGLIAAGDAKVIEAADAINRATGIGE